LGEKYRSFSSSLSKVTHSKKRERERERKRKEEKRKKWERGKKEWQST